jgi:hypothetical protein
MNSESVKTNISGAVAKWIILGLMGIACIITALICYFRRYYTWVLATAFVGCFLASTAWKKVRLLRASVKAIKEGRSGIVLFYRDGNLKETQETVIPAGSDRLYFYGFSPERNDTRSFRWNRVIRAQENGKDLNQDDIVSRIKN